jgi:hypothetical protein
VETLREHRWWQRQNTWVHSDSSSAATTHLQLELQPQNGISDSARHSHLSAASPEDGPHDELFTIQNCFNGRRFAGSATKLNGSKGRSSGASSAFEEVLNRMQSAGELTRQSECVICMEASKSTGFVHKNCVHLCACRKCAERWFAKRQACPVCNASVEGILPVFK